MNTILNDNFLILLRTDYLVSLFENDFKSILPEFFLIVITIILLIYGVIYSTSKKNNYPSLLTPTSWLCLLSYIFTFLLIINNPISNSLIFYNTLIIDYFTYFFKLLIILGSFFSVIISIDYTKKEAFNSFEYIILIMFATCSMMLLTSSMDFISMYLTIELQSLCFYVIAAFKRNSEFSTEAGIKYFLLGAFSSGLLLFGCSLIYGFTGTTNLLQLSKIFLCENVDNFIVAPLEITSLRACELGMIFILVGFLFKLTAAPFHMWAPDVYEGAPTSVTAFFAITPKVAILGIFLRIFLESFYNFMEPWQTILIFSSIASMLIGSLAAMSQNKLKRLLAFSSIGHVGYLLIGFSCGTIEGLQSLLIYLIIYIVMTINFFAIILSPVKRDFIHSIKNRLKYTTDLSMLAKTNPLLALTLTITLFSMAGIPPLAGFYSKAFLFFASVSSTMYLLAILGVLTSVISCFYYIRIIKIMYFEKPKNWCSFYQISKETSLCLAIGFFFILFFMIYPSPIYFFTHKVALTFCL